MKEKYIKEAKYMYEFTKQFYPTNLGVYIIEYVESLKLENEILKQKLNK